MKFSGYVLFAIHLLLGVWSLGGFIEMLLDDVPWSPFTNPQFPNWLLLFHWGSVLFASVSFCYGYLTHWPKTPLYMSVAYALMALVCVVETFGYMTSDSKYLAMAAEYAAYIFILFLLYKSDYFIDYFN